MVAPSLTKFAAIGTCACCRTTARTAAATPTGRSPVARLSGSANHTSEKTAGIRTAAMNAMSPQSPSLGSEPRQP